MKKFAIWSILVIFGQFALADTPPIIYQFAAPLVKSNNKNVSIPAATNSVDGYLTSIDHSSFNGKEPAISSGTNSQYWRGDKSFQTLNTLAVPELTNLYFTNARAQGAVSASSPLVDTAGVFSIPKATSSVNGYLSSSDWSTFNNKLDKTAGNYITNPDFEVNVTGWNLYNDSGNTTPASVVIQDITYTSTLSGSGGNGATITYNLCGSSYVGPVVTCPTGTSVQVCWYNGPTLAQNPTATVLKAAYDAQSCATAIATSSITGTAGNRQYETGTSTLAGGGDTSPVDGTGGVVSGITFTRNTSTPLVGIASGDLGKSAANEQGQGVSTDFVINALDKNQTLQISFAYEGSTSMVLGSSSDVQVFLYDIGNAVFIPISGKTLAGPTNTPKTFVGIFTASNSSNYRLILHNISTNASAWDLLLDSVMINNIITPTTATQVPLVVIKSQPISGAVTDHMAVIRIDASANWVPLTFSYNGDYWGNVGFAINIVGATADIAVAGALGGFSNGPFVGYNAYVDPSSAGGITFSPSPLTDTYTIMGKSIDSTTISIQPTKNQSIVGSTKGALVTSTGANDGSGDVFLAGGTTGQFLMSNTSLTDGLVWTTPVATSPITYTASTHTFALSTVPIASGGTGSTTFTSNSTLTSLTALTTASSLATVGTITTGTWSGTTIAVNKGGTGVTSVTTTPAATSWAGWDANKNLSYNGSIPGFTSTATAAGTTVMTIASTETQVWTGSTTQTIKLPTTSVAQGQKYHFINLSSGSLTIQSSGANTITTETANTKLDCYALVATPTTAANWSCL